MSRKAFTLVELLVVVAIMVVLVSILSDALRLAQDHARSIKCRSNQHQFGISFSLYESDQSTLPYGFDTFRASTQNPPGGLAGNALEDRSAWWWFHYLSPYIGKEFGETSSLVRCSARNVLNKSVFENPLLGNYGVNQSICKSTGDFLRYEAFVGKPLGTEHINHPSETFVLIDSGYSIINWYHATDNPPWSLEVNFRQDTAFVPSLWINQLRDIWSDQLTDALEGRHLNQSVNALFGDGHVENLSSQLLYVDNSDGEDRPTAIWKPN
jgi:prepilin-type N-terminal cleavage/methylation domain-containing protein/prepilin-type processing-associated H-X9-DG protein